MTSAVIRPGVRRGTIPVFATATAIPVSNIYFTQPLLDEIAHSFHTAALPARKARASPPAPASAWSSRH
ncbi:hypothetical protein G6W51_20075 [Streptomyces coelicolor]|uniref:hypothetical protein n=1 Tax=Streptomyces sp. I5 TaxID=2759947 RepID=UPI0015865572|nr:hypothetical protein [Streptomyces sp. I5]MBJ6630483.1 hypothetical protein [Streptomyces sp. I5]NUV55161.1 hypothetical protein [Streptomyces coelicolor]